MVELDNGSDYKSSERSIVFNPEIKFNEEGIIVENNNSEKKIINKSVDIKQQDNITYHSKSYEHIVIT